MVDPLIHGTEWNFATLDRITDVIFDIGINELGLDPYPAQLEIITSEQMVDAYCAVGMPIFYHHWSFGKHFTSQWTQYQRGMMGLAYEIVINSNPCIAYLMEENTIAMQALTIAHASTGHSHFFHHNYLFRQWTDAESIIDYLVFAREYIKKCEVREGMKEVEAFLDSCHSLMNYGINRFKRPSKLSPAKERKREDEREAYDQAQKTELSEFFKSLQTKTPEAVTKKFPKEPEENILYFCEKYAPDIPVWKREIIRIVRKISQYFYPQGLTKVMNEGAACFSHYRIMNRLHEKGLMTDGCMLEFLQSHTNVIFQPAFDDPRYSGLNPYALGFAMMQDIERICREPTDEDWEDFPQFAGCGEEMAVLKDAWENYRDESFIRQFLSRKVIRDMGLFRLKDNRKESNYLVTAIHDKRGYDEIRETLADSHERHEMVPQIEVVKVEPDTRVLHLEYKAHNKRTLGNAEKVIQHIQALWGHPVTLHDDKGTLVASSKQ